MNKSLATLLVLLVFTFLTGGRGSVASAQAPDGAPHERVQQQRAPAACPPDIQWGCVLSGSTSPGLSLNSTSTANNSYSLYASLNNPGSGSAAVWGRVLGTGSRGYGVYGSHQGSGYGVYGYSNNGIGFLGYSNTGTGMQGETFSTGDRAGVLGLHRATSGTGAGVEGRTNSTSDGATGVLGVVASSTAHFRSAGVHGLNHGSGRGVYGQGYYGVVGESTANGIGVYGNAPDPGGYGVWAQASASGGYGVHASGGTYGIYARSSSIAGYFQGDVTVSGILNVSGTKNFQIDHPLDPENQYLRHAALESSEVLNLYSGNVVLDEEGEAVVELPAWFTAINSDFRYQLTAIGASGSGLYIAEKVEDNRFKIAGGTARMEVSWLVTALRSDAYMQANPFQVEVPKPEDERGTYLYPEGYGQPESRGVDYEEQQRMREMQDGAPPAPAEVPGG